MIEKRGDRINTRHILLKPKVDEKDLEAALLRLGSIANDIRNEKFTFDDAATYISHDSRSWDRYKKSITDFLDWDAGRQIITWAKNINQLLCHAEDSIPKY